MERYDVIIVGTGAGGGTLAHTLAPTGKRISARGMQIARSENGQIVERWGSSDELGILKQLGVTPQRGARQPA